MTIQANKIDRQAIMQAAWQLFRDKYHYPQIPFRSIGRPCFGWCLSEAYRQARIAAQVASIPADEKAARIAELKGELELAGYVQNHWQRQARTREISAAISQLAA